MGWDLGDVAEVDAATLCDGTVAVGGDLDAASRLLGAHRRELLFEACDFSVVAVDGSTEQLKLELGWGGV